MLGTLRGRPRYRPYCGAPDTTKEHVLAVCLSLDSTRLRMVEGEGRMQTTDSKQGTPNHKVWVLFQNVKLSYPTKLLVNTIYPYCGLT